MITIPFIIITVVLGYFLSDKIRKYHIPIYIVFTIIGVITSVIRKQPLFMPFYKGFIGLAIFYVVMMIGVLGKKTKLYKRLFAIRAELSIIAFIVLTPHAIYYLIDKLFNSGPFELLGVVAYIIMVPLFITSFKKIRAKFKFYEWKQVQNFAYFVYLLIFVHLLLSASLQINFVLYLVLFVPYIIYKPIFYFKHEKAFYQKIKTNYLKGKTSD